MKIGRLSGRSGRRMPQWAHGALLFGNQMASARNALDWLRLITCKVQGGLLLARDVMGRPVATEAPSKIS